MRTLVIPYFEDNLAHLIQDGPDTLLIDAGDSEELLHALKDQGIALTHLLLTHHHWDHIDGVRKVMNLYPGLKLYHPPFANDLNEEGTTVHEGDKIPFGSGHVSIMATPFHTRTSICYLYQGHIYTGDSLFVSGCGRMFEGRPKELFRAMERFRSLPPEMLCHIGHDYATINLRFAKMVEPKNPHLNSWTEQVKRIHETEGKLANTTIGQELKTNPFLRIHEPDLIHYLDPDRVMTPVDRIGRLRELRNQF